MTDIVEFVVDGYVLLQAALPPDTILAPGALSSQIGKTVPVTVGEGDDKKQIGEATFFQDKEGISASIRLTEAPSEVFEQYSL
jgi:hypothetical protein